MAKNQSLYTNKALQSEIAAFVGAYGEAALWEAMQQYRDMSQVYLCKTKSCVWKIKISDIYYLEIHRHNIIVHTSDNTYGKYGTLSRELSFLSPYGFIKCNQSCIVSLNKIKTIQNDKIVLADNTRLHISRTYVREVLVHFNSKKYRSLHSPD